jgi:hypothetical protein
MTREPAEERGTLWFAGSLVAVVVTFRLLDLLLARLALLPPSAYDDAVFLQHLPRHWVRHFARYVSWEMALLGVALLLAGALARRRRVRDAVGRYAAETLAGWSALDEGRSLRWLILAVTGVAAWVLSTYSVNLFLDRTHAGDRLTVVVLWAAIAWRPIMVLPFALVARAVAGQFLVPLGFITWTEMHVVLAFPVIFGAFWLVRAATGERRSDVFLFAWCCLLASTYWASGLGKLRVDWLGHPHVSLLLLGAYANGWVSFLDAAAVVRLAQGLARIAGILMVVTVAIEVSSLVLLWRRWTLVLFLALVISFHLGAFALTGIFFWKWIVLDVCVLAYLLRGRRLPTFPAFTSWRFGVSVVVILCARWWAHPQNLTWFDTPLTYSLRFEGVDEGGGVHPLPAGFFRPYSEAVVMGTFATVSPHAQLTTAMGVTQDRSLAEALVAARSASDVLRLEQALGEARQDANFVAAFDAFVGAYGAHARCAVERDPAILRLLGPPRHLWTFPREASLPCGHRLARIRVHEVTTFYDGASLAVIRHRLLRDVAAVAPPPSFAR